MANLVRWNVEVLARRLKEVVAERAASPGLDRTRSMFLGNHLDGMPLDEVVDIVTLPPPKDSSTTLDFESIQLDEAVMFQLHQFV